MKGWKARVIAVKRDIRALGFVLAHPRTPWYAKTLAVLVVAYAISPIDLIPDPIPVLGYLDDVILLPIGVWLAVRAVPPDILAECRRRAEFDTLCNPWLRWIGDTAVLLIWGVLLWVMVCHAWKWRVMRGVAPQPSGYT